MFRKKLKISKSNYLDIVPVRLKEYEINEKGFVDIIIPRFESNFAKKYIVPYLKSPVFKLNLDEFGSEVFINIDGIKDVKGIGNILVEKFGDRIQPVYERLTIFLTQLYHNEIITFKEIRKE